MLPPLFLFIMYPHFFDGAKKRRYPPKKRFPTPAVCSRKRCPLHKGTKALHRKNGGSDSRPPSFRPTAVFILHLPPGYFWLDLAGLDYNPSVICFANATSLCTREAFLRVRASLTPTWIGGCFFAHRRGGYHPPVFYWMGLTPFCPRCGHLPSREGHSLGF